MPSVAKKISRKASAYAPLRRKTKRAPERVRHDKDKDKTTTKTRQTTKTKNNDDKNYTKINFSRLINKYKIPIKK
jgi:hypothetical protein